MRWSWQNFFIGLSIFPIGLVLGGLLLLVLMGVVWLVVHFPDWAIFLLITLGIGILAGLSDPLEWK